MFHRRFLPPAAIPFFLLWFGSVGIGSSAQFDLLPVPSKVLKTDGRFSVTDSFTVASLGESGPRAQRAAERFLDRLSGRTGLFLPRNGETAVVPGGASFLYKAERPGALVPGEDESYHITVSPDRILLIAPTDLGVLHGFETVLQLLTGDAEGYFIPCVQIEDAPRFPWRGLLIDSGRHFQPVEVIKRNLDGLAAVKMNVLHWHLTEDQGFRVESKLFPRLHQLGSNGLYYTQTQIRDIVAYAADRGIRVMPEFDIPGHSTSWFAAFPELASGPGPYRPSRIYGIQNPAFNPANPNVYAFLDDFFGEMASLFPDPFLHIGGDENNGKQWDANSEIQLFKTEKGLADNHSLQAYFNTRILEILKKHDRRMIGWDEIFQPGLPKDIVIHSWRGAESLVEAARQGYAGILSNGYYIDLCQTARELYLNDPLPPGLDLPVETKQLVWGGEATMWSEIVTSETIDSRIGPRTAAIAERLWSPGDVRDVEEMYRRLEIVAVELEELGLTHFKNKEMMLRRLAGGMAIGPLAALVDVLEPVKGYKRHSQGKAYTTSSPFTRVVDAAAPESRTARQFALKVDTFLSGRDAVSAEALKSWLVRWRSNHEQLKPLFRTSPVLREIEPLSFGLSEAAGIAIQAIDALQAKTRGDKAWAADRKKTLAGFKKSTAEVELSVVRSIEKLVAATNGD
jgi:hexosaminidase